jgi:hypothetical protein
LFPRKREARDLRPRFRAEHSPNGTAGRGREPRLQHSLAGFRPGALQFLDIYAKPKKRSERQSGARAILDIVFC